MVLLRVRCSSVVLLRFTVVVVLLKVRCSSVVLLRVRCSVVLLRVRCSSGTAEGSLL